MSKIDEAKAALQALGLPPAQCNEMSALTLLALCGLREADSWKNVARKSLGVTKGIMAFMKAEYGVRYAANTRETVRRFVLHQFVQARLVDYNPDAPGLPTNSPRAHYAVSNEAAAVLRTFGSRRWKTALAEFRSRQASLSEIYRGEREQALIPVRLPNGREVRLSAGPHNVVEKAVVEQFGARFAPGSALLYLGDTADKDAVLESAALEAIGVSLTERTKLPDVILHARAKNWLFLVEAVTSHGPMTPKRVHELKACFAGASAGLVFVTAFLDFIEFRKHVKQIAWETEVWIVEMPDHMIHFNGDRFLGPHD